MSLLIMIALSVLILAGCTPGEGAFFSGAAPVVQEAPIARAAFLGGPEVACAGSWEYARPSPGGSPLRACTDAESGRVTWYMAPGELKEPNQYEYPSWARGCGSGQAKEGYAYFYCDAPPPPTPAYTPTPFPSMPLGAYPTFTVRSYEAAGGCERWTLATTAGYASPEGIVAYSAQQAADAGWAVTNRREEGLYSHLEATRGARLLHAGPTQDGGYTVSVCG